MEVMLLRLGGAVAKSVLSLWIGDKTILGNMSGAAIDTLVEQVPNLNIFERRRITRQFDRMAESVAEKLEPFLRVEFGGMPENERAAAVLGVADAIERANINISLLLSQDLNPLKLEDHVRAAGVGDRQLLIPAAAVLYDHLLREACNYAVEIAVTLPPFSSKAARESLRRETEIIELINTVLSKLPDPVSTGRDAQDADLQFETQYRRTIARRLDFLELFGLDVSPLSKRYALSVAYITLSASDPGAADESDAAPVRVNEALAGNRFMLVRGDAGSGKTTLLQWLAVTAARKTFESALADWNDSVPFFIQLRRFGGRPLPQPEDFVAAVAPAEAGRMPDGWAHRQLETGRALVLVDGVDELSDDDRQQAHEWLLDLTSTFDGSRYIVTSRPSTPEDWLTTAGFRNCTLQPMTLRDVEKFVDHWHNAIRSALPDAEDQAHLDQLSIALMATLRSRPSVRGLATNPLLCAMLCALNRERSEHLPEDRMELYRVALELLLERRDVERRVSESARLPLKEKQILLRDLAYWLVLNNYVYAEQDAAIERIAQKLPSMQRITYDANTVFRYLLERSGILRSPTEGRVDFVHRTFQEYLAAEESVQQDHIGLLVANAHHDQWREVIILAAGHASLTQREALLRGLLDRGNHETAQQHVLHLLACACLETSPEVPTGLTAELQDALSRLVPPRNMTEAQSVSSAGSLAVPLLGGFNRERARVTAACVRTLGTIGGDEALDMLTTYAGDHRVAVINELLRAWASGEFDPNDFAQRVLAKSVLEELNIDNVALLPSIRYLPGLRRVRIYARLTAPGLEAMREARSLDSLYALYMEDVSDLMPLQTVVSLQELSLHGCTAITDISPLSHLSALRVLRLFGCTSIEDLSPLRVMTALSEIAIGQAARISDISPVEELIALTSLELTGSSVSDLRPLQRLTELRRLVLRRTSVSDITPLANLRQLRQLNLNNCNVTDLTPLRGLTQLRTVGLDHCPVSDLLPLAHFSELDLSLSGWPMTDLTSVAPLTQLRRLDLSDGAISDIGLLPNLSELRDLDLGGCNVADLTPLLRLPKLERLTVKDSQAARDPALEPFYRSLKRLAVDIGGSSFSAYDEPWRRIGSDLVYYSAGVQYVISNVAPHSVIAYRMKEE